MTHLVSRVATRGLALTGALSLAFVSACNSGSSGGDQVGTVGEEMEKPGGGGTFFVDANEGGSASKLFLVELAWGRLVDVHDIDEATGEVDPAPVFRDFVINETLQADGQSFLLETNPVTQRTRLVILREKKDDETDEFLPLLQLAAQDLSPVQPKSDLPGTAPPFSFIARNSALVLRFSDLLQDSQAATLALPETVKVLTNYPPKQPFLAKRMLFDPNHGGIADGEFHSTRLILDMTVSESEAAAMIAAPPLNALGLPASFPTTQQANVSVRIPTANQFSLLTNLSNHVLTTSGNGPVDFTVPTIDVVRAMRSGNPDDENNGFLLDLNPPELLSGWPITVTSASDAPGGEPGFDFVVDMTFSTPCRSQPVPGNILELAGVFVEVSELAPPPDLSGQVPGVQVRSLSETAISASALLGGGLFQRTYEAGLLPGSLLGCWVSFAPLPGTFPATDIAPHSQILLRFSEPMDPATVTPFDSFRVSQNDAEDPGPFDLIVGEVGSNGDLKEWTFTPVLPYPHTNGSAEEYNVRLLGQEGITDLAGNAPVELPDFIAFNLDPDAEAVTNDGLVLAFDSLDELAPAGPDWRGQFLYDFERKLIKPRQVARSAAVADRSQSVPGIMIPFPGVQTPLSPLGSKMMTLWRYCDVGFSAQDEGTYNMDVEGLNWSPLGGQVVSDFYPQFEIRLAHSVWQPDEVLAAGLPEKPESGLVTTSYAANVLPDPLSPQKIVHPKSKPYLINPVDQFVAPTGTRMMPFPLNKGIPPSEAVYYTWRDNAVYAEGATIGYGIDLKIMETVGLIPPVPTMLPPGGEPPPGTAGWLAIPGQVPSVGLPLLMEFRCYPADEGIGLNSFDVSLAINTSIRPYFRIFSTGGLNQSGVLVTKNPDLEDKPTGGFNPASGGAPTPVADPVFYIGQMDLITRISRVHSVWIDTNSALGAGSADFLDPVLDPLPEAQPSGTQLIIAYRGASSIDGDLFGGGTGFAFQAERIDPYGDVRKLDTTVDPDTLEFFGSLTGITYLPAGDKTWKDDIDLIDGARFVQLRVTFVGNTTTLLSSELSGFGLPWDIVP